MLAGPETDLMIVGVRLPAAWKDLTSEIVKYAEREAAKHLNGFKY